LNNYAQRSQAKRLLLFLSQTKANIPKLFKTKRYEKEKRYETKRPKIPSRSNSIKPVL